MVCFKLGDFLGDQMLPVCILWDHTDIFFLQFLTSFCSLTLVVWKLSFKHLYVPQTRRWLTQKYLQRGASRDMEVWVSTARGLFWIGWTIMRLQWFAVTEQMHSLLICHRDMQMQGRTGTGDYYQCSKICGGSTFSSGSYMQLFHVSSSNNLVVWFPHNCISCVFSLSLVAAKKWLVKVTCRGPLQP